MKTYPQQHEPWRPDYPPVWFLAIETGSGLDVFDIQSNPFSNRIKGENILAFSDTVDAINKAMKS